MEKSERKSTETAKDISHRGTANTPKREKVSRGANSVRQRAALPGWGNATDRNETPDAFGPMLTENIEKDGFDDEQTNRQTERQVTWAGTHLLGTCFLHAAYQGTSPGFLRSRLVKVK
ncbi:hypothetical protein E4U42_005104 [Claviceps africana]|uniref:Uncharacterized protein n=1 Tax=Claviceps africana TaxID=83212 RepID=A0A8K0JCG1_9HYPO|nr:hypothetical protein E4U42_005104 [Claviceps africana]